MDMFECMNIWRPCFTNRMKESTRFQALQWMSYLLRFLKCSQFIITHQFSKTVIVSNENLFTKIQNRNVGCSLKLTNRIYQDYSTLVVTNHWSHTPSDPKAFDDLVFDVSFQSSTLNTKRMVLQKYTPARVIPVYNTFHLLAYYVQMNDSGKTTLKIALLCLNHTTYALKKWLSSLWI